MSLVMVMWTLDLPCAFSLRQGSNVVVEAIHFRMEMMLEMACAQGEHYFLLFNSDIHCWNYDILRGFHCAPHVML